MPVVREDNGVAHFLDDGAKVIFFSEIKPTLLGSTEINSIQGRKKLSLNLLGTILSGGCNFVTLAGKKNLHFFQIIS